MAATTLRPRPSSPSAHDGRRSMAPAPETRSDPSSESTPEPTSTTNTPARTGRKGSKKVRTGCITCKIRRVKCDEAKPACARCTSTGRKCDGYLYLPRHGDGNGNDRDNNPRRSRSSLVPFNDRPHSPGPVYYTLSQTPDWNSLEQRSFHFYRTYTSNVLFAPTSSVFWARIVPGLCYREPAIRHAVLAISDLHERGFHSGTPGGPSRCRGPGYPSPSPTPASAAFGARTPKFSPFAATQYGKALRALREWKPPSSSSPTRPDDRSVSSPAYGAPSSRSGAGAGAGAGDASTAVPLLACVLFICVEFMLDNTLAAQMHINQGRQVLAHFELEARNEEKCSRPSSPSPCSSSNSSSTTTTTAATAITTPSSSSSVVDLVRRELVPIFTRLSIAAYPFGSFPVPIPTAYRATQAGAPPGGNARGQEFGGMGPVRPEMVPDMTFVTVAEAERALYELMDDGMRATMMARSLEDAPSTETGTGAEMRRSVSSGSCSCSDSRSGSRSEESWQAEYAGVMTLRARTLAGLEKWHAGFTALRATTAASCGGETQTETETTRMCRLMYLTSSVYSLGFVWGPETRFDEFTSIFADMVLVAGEILDADEAAAEGRDGVRDPYLSGHPHPGGSPPSRGAAGFTFEVGVVPSLYYVAVKSRHPELRRAAITLLRRRARVKDRENLWSAGQVATVAEKVVFVEEERAARYHAEAAAAAASGWVNGASSSSSLAPSTGPSWYGDHAIATRGNVYQYGSGHDAENTGPRPVYFEEYPSSTASTRTSASPDRQARRQQSRPRKGVTPYTDEAVHVRSIPSYPYRSPPPPIEVAKDIFASEEPPDQYARHQGTPEVGESAGTPGDPWAKELRAHGILDDMDIEIPPWAIGDVHLTSMPWRRLDLGFYIPESTRVQKCNHY